MPLSVKRLAILASIAMVLMLIVAACGGGGEATATPKPPSPTATPVPPQPTATQVAQPTATAVPQPTATPVPQPTAAPTPKAAAIKRGGTLTFPQNQDLITFDATNSGVYQTYYFMGSFVWNQIVRFDNKTWTDSDIVGDLATSWSVSADAKKWTFKLDPKARWQNVPPVNGRPLVAADIKWFLDKLLDPTFKNSNAGIIRDIASIEAPDNQTVVFNLKDTFAGFADALASYTLKILPKEQFDRDGGFDKAAIGSGPFTFDKHDRGTRLAMNANPNYWKLGVDGKPLPYFDRVEVVVGADDPTVLAAMRAGKIDFNSPGTIDPDVAQKFLKDNPQFRWTIDFKLFADEIHGNLTAEPWKSNKKLRQALLKAVDQEAIKKNVIFEPDAPNEGPITAGMGVWAVPQGEVKAWQQYDPEGAKKILAELGYGPSNPLKVNLFFILPFPPGTQSDRYAQILGPMLKQAGFDTTVVVPSSPAEGFGKYFSYKGYDIGKAFVGFEGDIYNWFRNFFATGGPRNWFGLSDPALDAQISEFGRIIDRNAQIKKALDIQRYIMDQAYVVPLAAGRIYIPYQPWVKNFNRTWGWGATGVENLWLDR